MPNKNKEKKVPQWGEHILTVYSYSSNKYINFLVYSVESALVAQWAGALASRARVLTDFRVRDFTRIPARAPTLKRA